MIDLLTCALPEGAALHEPTFEGREWEYVKNCIDGGWVSSVGTYVDRFEDMLCDRLDCGNAIALVNGTAALHALLTSLGIDRGDEVVVPALTFVATANAIVQAGGTPHFADVDSGNLGLDPDRLMGHLEEIGVTRDGGLFNRETGHAIRAIVAVHAFGHPCDMDGLAAVADRFDLDLIEDAAESLGSEYKGRRTGALARAGTLSFNGNKTVTTGGGGAIVTNDAELADRIRHIATTAKKPHPWAYVHDAVGFNYRMPNINAALGCAQLEQLDSFVDLKRELAGWYRDQVASLSGAAFVDEPAECRSNFWLNAVLMDNAAERDDLLARGQEFGLRPAWEPMHRLPMYMDCPKSDLAVTEGVCDRLVNLPSGVAVARTILPTVES